MTWKSLRSFPLLFVLAVSTTGHAAIPARRAFSQSVMPIDVSGATGGPHLTRTALSVKERSEPVDIVVSLAMRDYAAFAARIMSGAKIPQAEMEPFILPEILAGEALQGSLAQQIYEQNSSSRILNLYGPSEDTTYSTYAHVEKGGSERPTIGRPIFNTQIYLLDRQKHPVPVGVPGEVPAGVDYGVPDQCRPCDAALPRAHGVTVPASAANRPAVLCARPRRRRCANLPTHNESP